MVERSERASTQIPNMPIYRITPHHAPADPSRSNHAPNFNRIARPYRWLEYLIFGPALQRCRLHFLPRLLHSRRALVLGDGDGRFLARLLAANPRLHAVAVDLSPQMLHLLGKRAAPATNRLTTYQADARTFQPHDAFDLVVTHFFLDCLTQPELDQFITRLSPHLSPGALWLLSDFRIPTGHLRLPARALVRLLYLAFRALTGLRTTRLPDHAVALHRHGLIRLDRHLPLRGILTTELWQRPPLPTEDHLTPNTSAKEPQMTTPSPVPDLPPTPGTDLPTGPASDPIPNPEPPSPSIPDPDPAVFNDPSPS